MPSSSDILRILDLSGWKIEYLMKYFEDVANFLPNRMIGFGVIALNVRQLFRVVSSRYFV